MRDAFVAFAEMLWDGGWRITVLSAALGLLLCGWFAWTLSPIQRYYFPAYVSSSLHIAKGEEPDLVAWLVKSKTKKDFEIAGPADVVPTAQGRMPFALSPEAIKQGWTGTRFLPVLSFEGGSQRAILQDNFFGGRSLGWLLFQPTEILAVPLVLWASFVRWRYNREQTRSQSWARTEPSWSEDAVEFAGELFGAVKFSAVNGWHGLQAGLAARKSEQEIASAPRTIAVIPEKKMEPVSEPKLSNAVAMPSLKPRQVEASPEPAVELPRAQTLPFRKGQTAAKPSEKWDESKWID